MVLAELILNRLQILQRRVSGSPAVMFTQVTAVEKLSLLEQYNFAARYCLLVWGMLETSKGWVGGGSLDNSSCNELLCFALEELR